jgi:hypothetical protein
LFLFSHILKINSAMALTKTLFGAWAVSVGASECANATLWQIPVGLVEEGCFPTDVAVDSSGNVWITSSCSTWMCPSYGDDVGECWSVGTDSDLKFAATGIAIAVDDSGIQGENTTLYISQNNGVMKCTWNHSRLDCLPFGEDWDEPHGLAMDHEGNLLVTNDQGHHGSDAPPVKTRGVWRCSPRADCVLVGGSNDMLYLRGVAADSQGTVYFSGAGHGCPFLYQCTSSGECKHFAMGMCTIGLGVAVGPDDYVYMTEITHSFARCSSDEVCERFAPDGFPDGPMAIDRYGAVYTATRSFSDSPAFSELHLIKSCIDPPTALLV